MLIYVIIFNYALCDIGAYDEEEAAARAYDLAALKYWGPGTLINFPVSISITTNYFWVTDSDFHLPISLILLFLIS